MSTEARFLLAASRVALDDEAHAALLSRIGNLDWGALVRLAHGHGVTALLCRSLLALRPGVVPDDMVSASRALLEQRRADNAALLEQLVGILSSLRSTGVDAIPFKGPMLALRAYGDLGLRSFADLDFLIRPSQIQACMDCLGELGYEGMHHLTPRQWRAFCSYGGQDILFGPGAPVEPHWEFAPRTLSVDIDYPALWSRARLRAQDGTEVLAMAPEDELTSLCLHGAKERWTRLKWVADVAEFVRRQPDMDWDAVVTRSNAQGVQRIVGLGLSLGRGLLGLPLPANVGRWMEKDRFAADWGERLVQTFFAPRETATSIYALSGFHWDMRERLPDRLRYACRTLTQPRVQHFGSIAIPDHAFFLYVPYKLGHDYLALPVWRLWKQLLRRGAAATTNPGDTDAAR